MPKNTLLSKLIAIVSFIFLLSLCIHPSRAEAGTLTNVSITAANSAPNATTAWTFSFTTATLVPATQDMILQLNLPNGFGMTNADPSAVSVTINGVSASVDTRTGYVGTYLIAPSTAGIRLNQSVAAGSNVTITISGLVNPSSTGSYQTLLFRTANGGGNPYDTVVSNPSMVVTTPDTTAPSVSVTSPTSTSTVSGTSVSLTATSTDNIAVAGVKFYIDGTLQGSEDTSSPYGITWNSTATTSGSHTVFAVSRDTSNNIATSSSVTFATDNTAPTISSINPIPGSTTASVYWNTNEIASSQVVYSPNLTYASTTAELDTTNRVLSHGMIFSNLVACTQYYFKVVSTDGYSNTATSSDQGFTTTGCPGGAALSAATTHPIALSATSTSQLNDGGSSIVIATPVNFASTTSNVTVQIQSLDSGTVLGSIGNPSGRRGIGSKVFDVKALIDSGTTLDSFDLPVTIAYTYSDADVAGFNESTIMLYHYHNGAWSALDSCSVNMSLNIITCTTPSFSIFSLFGTSLATGGLPSVQTAAQAYGCADSSAINYQANVLNNAAVCRYDTSSTKATGNSNSNSNSASSTPVSSPSSFSLSSAVSTSTVSKSASFAFSRTLQKGMIGADVLALQKMLNLKGYLIASTGPGSSGSETTKFGPATQTALIKFQKTNGITPAVGIFGPVTKTFVSSR